MLAATLAAMHTVLIALPHKPAILLYIITPRKRLPLLAQVTMLLLV
jgi:hypothetical protein